MEASQRKLLARRLRLAAKQQPEIRILREKLLAVGGEELVAPAFADADIPALIDEGSLISGKIIQKPMERSASHRNAARLWFDKRHRLSGVGTGYALSDDGLWRQHSWGAREGQIIETTVARLKYFGLILRGTQARLFTLFNFGE